MEDIEFKPWPKTARWNRDIVITEKIDGTNGAIGIKELVPFDNSVDWSDDTGVAHANGKVYRVYAQSRNRIVSLHDNHFGFAQWVNENRDELAGLLGEGIHFGEWWGSGIARGYGLSKGEKWFSLFNTSRWNPENTTGVPNLTSVPVLYQGMMDSNAITSSMVHLRTQGSVAAPGFERPEGIIIFHTAANSVFKITLEKDEAPKSKS